MFYLFEIESMYDLQARSKVFQVGGARGSVPEPVPLAPKSWWGTPIYFTTYRPKVGGARAPPAPPVTTGLNC